MLRRLIRCIYSVSADVSGVLPVRVEVADSHHY